MVLLARNWLNAVFGCNFTRFKLHSKIFTRISYWKCFVFLIWMDWLCYLMKNVRRKKFIGQNVCSTSFLITKFVWIRIYVCPKTETSFEWSDLKRQRAVQHEMTVFGLFVQIQSAKWKNGNWINISSMAKTMSFYLIHFFLVLFENKNRKHEFFKLIPFNRPKVNIKM